jgi:predicted nucleotidyltransferase
MKTALVEGNFIRDFLRKKGPFIEKKFNIKVLGILGSVAKGTQNRDSDIDLLIETKKAKPLIFERKRQLKKYLENQFHRPIEFASEPYLKSWARAEVLGNLIPVNE